MNDKMQGEKNMESNNCFLKFSEVVPMDLFTAKRRTEKKFNASLF